MTRVRERRRAEVRGGFFIISLAVSAILADPLRPLFLKSH
jgi:hypothetical protein